MTPEQAASLRAPFAETDVGKLPKITCGACSKSALKHCDKHKKINCPGCGNWITEKHTHLDYVGHAAVTNRLLAVDPAWSWEPVAFDNEGNPATDRNGGMWIRLTICDTTRLGYGHADGKTGGNAIKEAIGDAIRNAAMRFGVAIDLWHKGSLSGALEPTVDQGDTDEPATQQGLRAVPDGPQEPAQRTVVRRQPRSTSQDWSKPADGALPLEQADPNLASAQQVRMMSALFNGKNMDDDQIDALILEASASRTTSRKELTRTEASALIDQLKQATA